MTDTEQKQWHCDGYLLYTLKDSGTYRKGEPVMVNEDMIRVSGDNADAVLARLQDLLSPPLPSPPVSGEAVALYQLELENGEIEHLSGCFGNVSEIDGVRVVKSTPLYASPLTNEPVGVTQIETAHLEWLVNEFEKGHFTGRKTAVKHALDFLSAAIGERG